LADVLRTAVWQLITFEFVARAASGAAPKRSWRNVCESSTARAAWRLIDGGPKAGGNPSHELSAVMSAPIVAFWTPAEDATHWSTVCDPRRPPAFLATQPRVSLDAAKVTFRMLLLIALMHFTESLAVCPNAKAGRSTATAANDVPILRFKGVVLTMASERLPNILTDTGSA
jgi:hypothetical protein